MMNKNKLIAFGLFLVLVSIFSITVFGATIDTPSISKLDVFDADIREVFRSLGELGNLSVLLDPAVKANVTIGLKEGLTVQSAIELLAQTYGYSYRWIPSSRTVIVGNEKTFENFDAKETRVYHFNYAQIDQVVDALKNIVPAEKMGVDKRTNQLTITASILQHQNIEEIAQHLDREMPEITIEIRVEEIQKTVLESAGVLWTMGGNGASSSDISLDFSKPMITVNAIHNLQLWEQNKQAKLLSNPKIATTDSQEGSVFIGDKFPVVTSSQVNNVTTYTITYIDMGTKLAVTPRINQDDIVTVKVNANVSSLSDWVQVGEFNKVPMVRNREISSVIRLRDGETFVLSGLNELKSVETNSGLKGISKIPIIGWLFKNRTTDPKSDTEVCIFITPKIVKLTKDAASNSSVTTNNDETKVNSGTNESQVKTTSEQKNDSNTSVANSTAEKNVDNNVVTATTDSKEQETDNPSVEPKNTINNQDTAESTETTSDTVEETAADDEQEVSSDDSADTQNEETDVQDKTVSETKDNETQAASEDKSQVAAPDTHTIDTENVTKVNYTVKSGESINLIAKDFGIDVSDIAKENNLQTNSKLIAGKSIVIPVPAAHLYQLKPKETLWRISKRYGIDIKLLQKINQIADITKVKAGQELVLPVNNDQIVNSGF